MRADLPQLTAEKLIMALQDRSQDRSCRHEKIGRSGDTQIGNRHSLLFCRETGSKQANDRVSKYKQKANQRNREEQEKRDRAIGNFLSIL